MAQVRSTIVSLVSSAKVIVLPAARAAHIRPLDAIRGGEE